MEEITENFSRLDEEDRQKILDFIEILLEQSKYENLRKEIENRLAEIHRREVLTHEGLNSDFQDRRGWPSRNRWLP